MSERNIQKDGKEVLFPNHCNDDDDGDAWFEDFPSEDDRHFILFACNNIEKYITAYEAEKTAREKAEVEATDLREKVKDIYRKAESAVPNVDWAKVAWEMYKTVLSTMTGQGLSDRMKAKDEKIERLSRLCSLYFK